MEAKPPPPSLRQRIKDIERISAFRRAEMTPILEQLKDHPIRQARRGHFSMTDQENRQNFKNILKSLWRKDLTRCFRWMFWEEYNENDLREWCEGIADVSSMYDKGAPASLILGTELGRRVLIYRQFRAKEKTRFRILGARSRWHQASTELASATLEAAIKGANARMETLIEGTYRDVEDGAFEGEFGFLGVGIRKSVFGWLYTLPKN